MTTTSERVGEWATTTSVGRSRRRHADAQIVPLPHFKRPGPEAPTQITITTIDHQFRRWEHKRTKRQRFLVVAHGRHCQSIRK